MMLLLRPDISADLLDIRLTHRKRTVSSLPEEIPIGGSLFLHPFRGVLLRLFHQIGDRDGTGEIAQDVNMILDAIDEDRLAANVLEHARHIGVESGADSGVFQKRYAILRAENEMQDNAGERLWHDGGKLLRPDGAWQILCSQTHGGARSSLALGWLVTGRWPGPLHATPLA